MTTPEELRARVAEKVMGWEDDFPVKEYSHKWRWKSDDGDWKYQSKYDWDPLESWADAGRVIERMEELGYCWLWRKDHLRLTVEYTAVFFEPSSDDPFGDNGRGDADGPLEAISLAALRALGVEVE